MKRTLHIACLVLLTGLSHLSFAQRDSSVSVVNRSAALLLIDEGDKLFEEGQVRSAMVKIQRCLR
jgi:hypothetical protein